MRRACYEQTRHETYCYGLAGTVCMCTVRPDRTRGPAGVVSQTTWSEFRQLPEAAVRAIDETHLYSGLAHNGGNNAKQQLLLPEREEAGIIAIDG